MSGRLPFNAMFPEALPEPESEQLAALLEEGSVRLVYGLLYRRRRNPPTVNEIGFFLNTAAASAGISADRALRSLETHFDVAAVIRDGTKRYELRGWAARSPAEGRPPLSPRRRAQALVSGTCGMCGKSVEQHRVLLEAELKVPPEWGGTTDPENLWALCEECLKGRRQYLDTYASYSEQLQHAAGFDEPQRRIGELLLALHDEWVPSELIGIVASAKEFQGDYERRIRDLRTLGWEYETRKDRGQGARVRVYYRLVRPAPWPENIRAAITAVENQRKAGRSTNKTAAGSDGAH
jgi:hypothetical protein